jgi:hypothetical protein
MTDPHAVQAYVEVAAGPRPGVEDPTVRRRWVVRGCPDAGAVEDRLRDRWTEAVHYAGEVLPFPGALAWVRTSVVWTMPREVG